MKVLLLSPRDPHTPGNLKYLMGGESTYTKMLLSHPPKDIKFIYFEDALQRGLISYHWTQQFFLWLQKLRILPLGPRVQSIIINTKFDLVYAHAYPVRLTGIKTPFVVSDSSSNIVFLKYYLKWPEWRIEITQIIKRLLFKLLGVVDGEINTKKADGFFVFSKWAKRIKNDELRIMNCEVMYPGLPFNEETSRLAYARSKNKTLRLLFVGVWFERKGGRILLAAYRRIKKQFPHVSLTILGPLPKDVDISDDRDITQKDYVSYRELLDLYKTHDVLVHVPPEIEGYGMAVPEAMSFGMIPIVSNICVLPEFVQHKKSGLIVEAGSVDSLEEAVITLIKNPALVKTLRRGAREKFAKTFSLLVFQKKLSFFFHNAVK